MSLIDWQQRERQFTMAECSYLGHIVGKGTKELSSAYNQEGHQGLPIDSLVITEDLFQIFPTLASQTSRSFGDQHTYQTAFDSLKNSFQMEPILKCPDYLKTFWLQTDASDCGVGAVLSQIGEDGLDYPLKKASPKRNHHQEGVFGYRMCPQAL